MEGGIALARSDGWIETDAIIVRCKRTFLSRLQGSGVASNSFYEAPKYAITFHYSVGHKVYTGTYVAHSVQEVGSPLTIAYDPMKPGRNTGSNGIQTPWIRVVVWSVVIGLTALAAWLGFLDHPPV